MNNYPETTLVIFAYKHEKFIKEAVESALNQDYPNLTIIISDDNSPDRTFEIAQEVIKNYKGTHKIILNKNEKNLGHPAHLNYVLENLVKTDIYIGQSGDDVSLPNRVSKTMEIFNKYHDVYAVFSNVDLIDEKGKMLKKDFLSYKKGFYTLEDILLRPIVLGASASYKKEVFNKFGEVKHKFEDWELGYKSAMLGKVYYIDDVLLEYRSHDNNFGFVGVKKMYRSFKEYKEQKAYFYREHAKILLSILDVARGKRNKSLIEFGINFDEFCENFFSENMLKKNLLSWQLIRFYIKGKALRINEIERNIFVCLFSYLSYTIKKFSYNIK
ncbi:glycosyltransferase [Hydrogenivirga sp. 128-5-R1-1]|uniref:glycosyltransferase n=1 Tax=Hydrogenivirga sp. 128-5-R1-1 TaxID=392423 RepID=UPI00015EF763|nr:glycosyltransferase [Hydrogenivirga sp. 128-5-R1-1]EDP75581.1 glycosyltransferase [Hydrogenivirga sp. 128-5-R1-1]